MNEELKTMHNRPSASDLHEIIIEEPASEQSTPDESTPQLTLLDNLQSHADEQRRINQPDNRTGDWSPNQTTHRTVENTTIKNIMAGLSKDFAEHTKPEISTIQTYLNENDLRCNVYAASTLPDDEWLKLTLGHNEAEAAYCFTKTELFYIKIKKDGTLSKTKIVISPKNIAAYNTFTTEIAETKPFPLLLDIQSQILQRITGFTEHVHDLRSCGLEKDAKNYFLNYLADLEANLEKYEEYPLKKAWLQLAWLALNEDVPTPTLGLEKFSGTALIQRRIAAYVQTFHILSLEKGICGHGHKNIIYQALQELHPKAPRIQNEASLKEVKIRFFNSCIYQLHFKSRTMANVEFENYQ
jgi:hypothetical protein